MSVGTGAIPELGFDAFDLLLDLLEREPSEISGSVLADTFPDAGRQLVECGALRPVANATVVACRACDADHAAEVELDPAGQGYRHFCAEAGWVAVPPGDLRQYRADPCWLVAALARGLGIPERSFPRVLVEDVAWDLGEAWLGDRKATVLFGRRLTWGDNVDRVWDALTNRVGRSPGLLLTTSTGLARHVDVPGRHRIVSLKDCAAPSPGRVVIDLDSLAGIVRGERPLHPDLPIQPSADFRLVRVGDRTFHFRGDKQRQVVEYLYTRWRDGGERVSTAAMFVDLEFSTSTRLRDLFKGHPDWRDLIGYGGGACWLKV